MADNLLQKTDPSDPELDLDEISSQVLEQPTASVAEKVGQLELGEPGLDLPVRADISTANTLQEKLNVFKKWYPDGDLIVVPRTSIRERPILEPPTIPGVPPTKLPEIEKRKETDLVFLFRTDPSKPLSKVDADTLEKFEPLGDLVDFIGEDIGAITGEIALTARTKGLRLIPLLGRLALGATTGELGQQGIQVARGVSEETLAQIGGRAGRQALVSVVGGVVAAPVESAIRVIRGGGLLRLTREQEAAIKTFERQGLSIPSPGQISTNPFVIRLEAQSEAIIPTLREFRDLQRREVVDKLSQSRDIQAKSGFIATLINVQQVYEQQLLKTLRTRTDKTFLDDVGKGLKIGQREQDRIAKKNVDDAYDIARSIEEPKYDLTDLKSEADQALKGTPALKESSEEVADVTGQLINLDPLDAELKDIAQTILQLKTVPGPVQIGNRIVSPTDQLKALRSRLWNLKQPVLRVEGTATAPRSTVHSARAERLYRSVGELMNNPANTNPDFRKTWGVASALAAQRFRILEKEAVISIAKTQKPLAAATALIRPGSFDDLLVLRKSVTNKSFKKLQEGFKTDLILDSSNITKRLDGFDRKTLNILMSQNDQKVFRQIGKEFDRLNKLNLTNLIERQGKAKAIIENLVSGATPADIDVFAKAIKAAGGINSTKGKSVRAALIDHIWDTTVKIEKNTKFVDPGLFKAKIRELEKKGLMRFLSNDRKSLFKDLQTIVDLIPAQADAGTSIMAMEVISGFRRKIFSPGELFAGPVLRLLHLFGFGRFLISKGGRRLLVGTKTRAPITNILKVTGGVLTTMADDMEDELSQDSADIEDKQILKEVLGP